MTTFSLVEPDVEAALGFLRCLYGSTHHDGWVNLFGIDKRTGQRSTAWAPLDALEELRPAVSAMGARGDLWFGVAPRRDRLEGGQRGTAAHCVSIPALWLDVDIAGPVHHQPELPKTKEEAVALVRVAPLLPRMVVQSGYGLQCWWPLADTVDALEAGEMLERWEMTWNGFASRMGVKVDNVHNIDRVMRLPGSYNWKGEHPVKVTVRMDPDWLPYQVAEMAEWLEELPAPEEKRARTSTAHLAGSRFNELIHPRIILLGHGFSLLRVERSNGIDVKEHYHYVNASNEVSATIYLEDEHATIWSETAGAELGLPISRPMDSFGLWARIEHDGDFAVAHAWLLLHGIPDLGQEPEDPVRPLDGSRSLVIVCAALVRAKAVDWRWEGWMPAGKLITLDGDPDVGKSTMALDLASRVTMGAEMPDGSAGGRPSSVVLLSGEDDMDDTIIWRLKAAGADLERVHHIQATTGASGESPFTIPGDLALLEELVAGVGAGLVIVDVLNEYLDDRVDGHKDQSIRRVLHRVRNVAIRTGAAVVMLRHLRKEGSDKAIYRGGGSIGIVGAARAGWTVGLHPDDDGLRVLAPVKMNLGPKPAALGFKLLGHPTYPCALVDWRGTVDIGADDLLSPGPRVDPDEQSQIALAMNVLSVILENGPVWSKDVLDEMASFKFGQKTVEKARARLGVRALQVRKPHKDDPEHRIGWQMYLPSPIV